MKRKEAKAAALFDTGPTLVLDNYLPWVEPRGRDLGDLDKTVCI